MKVIILALCVSAFLLAACQAPRRSNSSNSTQPTTTESVTPKNDAAITAEPAPAELAKKVRDSITIADSIIITDESRYQLHVLLGTGDDLMPVQIQLTDPKNPSQPLTMPLHSIDTKQCAAMMPSRGRSAYETKWMYQPPALNFAYATVKEVTIVVKSNGTLYTIDKLPVSGRCMSAIT